MVLLNLFLLFLKINLLTPSGPASYGLTEKLTVPALLDQEKFNRIVAVSAGIPGSDAIQMAWQVGYEIAKLPGAFVSVFGALLPCIMLVVLVTMSMQLIPSNTINKFITGVKPALFLLLLIYAAQLITPVGNALSWKFISMFVLSTILYKYQINSFIILVICGVIGLF